MGINMAIYFEVLGKNRKEGYCKMFHSKRQRNLSLLILGIYLFLLIWLILFKFNTNFRDLDHFRNINLIPFQGSLIVNGHLQIREILYNILVFVPLGVYIGILKPKWSFIKMLLPCFCLSFLLEILQFVFAIGASDITDVIGNTIGGIVGLAIFTLFKKLFSKKYITIINSIGLMTIILAIAMLGILFIANR